MSNDNYFYPANVLTGGSNNALDGIDGGDRADGDGAIVITNNGVYHFLLDEDSGANESAPKIIAPDSNGNNKRWLLKDVVAEKALVDYVKTLTAAGNFTIQTAGGNNALTVNNNQTVVLANGVGVNEFSNDATLSGNSDLAVPTEKAVKGYADGVATACNNYADSLTAQWVYGNQTATTSGTTVELITNIPASAVEVEVLLSGVSTDNNSQPPVIELGDAGGYETTGYVAISGYDSGGGTGYTALTDAIPTLDPNVFVAGDVVNAVIKLVRWDASEHLWLVSGTASDAAASSWISGTKTLSEALTSIRLNTPGATAAFDAGEARVRYR